MADKCKNPTSRLPPWALRLQEFDFDIIHRLRIANGNADGISCRQYPLLSSTSQASLESPSLTTINALHPSLQYLHTLQFQDCDLFDIITFGNSPDAFARC